MNNDTKRLNYIITGATSGIGKATAIEALLRNANVSVVARREKELKELFSSFPHAEIIPADITNDADRIRIIEKTLARFDGVDVLINAAGIIAMGSIENTTLENWDTMLDVNLRSLFRLTQLALPSLLERKGNIVNVSSVTGVRAFPHVLSYCISKAGVDQFTRCTALELASKGVRVNAVNPGVVVTNLHKTSGMSDETYQKFLEHSRTTHPLGRAGTPEEIAALILFLASENAGWITGETIAIDGGRAQTCAR
jgi:NAD(P)-dependent dehydrogenase (short-subunit alcohol dehydrogenase family)